MAKDENKRYEVKVQCFNCGENFSHSIKKGITKVVHFKEKKTLVCPNCECPMEIESKKAEPPAPTGAKGYTKPPPLNPKK